MAMPRTSLISYLQDFSRLGGDIAVVQRRGYRRETWTYRQIHRTALRVCALLARRGIGQGDRVLLWGGDSAEWVAAFWGVLARGAVAVPLDAGCTAEFAALVVRDSGARVAFAGRDQAAALSGCETLLFEERAEALADFSVEDGNAAIDASLARSNIAQILFTSGTTAEPRGVVLTHGNFLANLEPLESGIDPYRRWERWFHPLRYVTLVPLSHVFGQFMGLLVPPLLGSTIVFESSPNPAEIVRTVKRERATALIAVPRMLDGLRHALLREMEARGKAEWFSSAFAAAEGQQFLRQAWRFRRIHRQFGWKFWAFISGGAALLPETEEFFRRMGYAVVQGYGMTETASLISVNHPFRAAHGSVGKVLPGQEFRLAEDGEILVRGGNVASGYWEKGVATQRAEENDGWLRTGDIGELDAGGNLRFRGRKKNVIVTPAGLNVFPEDLEAALRRQPGVRDCAVVPLARGANAEACAALLLEKCDPVDATGTARAAIEAANAQLAEFQRMRSWIVWPEPDFPRTATGKPRLGVIATRASDILDAQAEKNSATAAPASSLDHLLDRFLRPAESAPDSAAHLERELNLTSLDRVELMSALESRYRVELNETKFAEAKTIADVERLLSEPSVHRTEYAYPRWPQFAPVRWVRLAAYYALVWPATQILGHPRIVGRENLGGLQGPILVVSNHITRRADIGLILAALPGRFRHQLATAMGGETLRNMRHPPREWFFLRRAAYWMGYWLVTALFNVFPLPQLSGFHESFRFAGESVDRGYSVLVFPEGVVNETETGEMAPFQRGIGLLAENLRIPIVPMRLDGIWGMKREGRRLAHRGEVTVRIGAPVTIPPGTPADVIAADLESRIRGL